MIPIIKSYDGKDVPSIAVDTNQHDLVPRRKILAEGGEPVEPVIVSGTFTENGTHNAPEGVDGYNPCIVNVQLPGIPVSDAEIVQELPVPPDVLPEGKLYIIPKGEQVVPAIPEDLVNVHVVICANTFNIQSDYDYITYDEVLTATKFWLYMSDRIPLTRRDQISKITWGTSATTSEPPAKIYEYDTTGVFAWVDITNEPDTVSIFENNVISHDVRDCLYSDVTINRYTVGNPQYLTVLNKVNSECRINNIYYIKNFDCYVVTEGVAVYDDTYTMYQLISNYIGGVNNG